MRHEEIWAEKVGKKRLTRRGKYISMARMPTSWGRAVDIVVVVLRTGMQNSRGNARGKTRGDGTEGATRSYMSRVYICISYGACVAGLNKLAGWLNRLGRTSAGEGTRGTIAAGGPFISTVRHPPSARASATSAARLNSIELI